MRSARATRTFGDPAVAVRHLRDLLRAQILEELEPTSMLASETELMVAYGSSRATVREALALLREEGLIDRVQGVGTFVVAHPVHARLVGANFRSLAEGEATSAVHPRILEQRHVDAPRPVARHLAVPEGTTCLLLEAVSMRGDEPTAVVTNYTLSPEAERLAATPFVHDWDELLADAGIEVGSSDYLLGAVGADAAVAALLGVAVGAPLTYLEQLTYDPSGRAFNFAVMYFRADRVMFSYRTTTAAFATTPVVAGCGSAPGEVAPSAATRED